MSVQTEPVIDVGGVGVNGSLRDRVQSLRLPEKADTGKGGGGSWLPWILVLLLGGTVVALAAKALPKPPADAKTPAVAEAGKEGSAAAAEAPKPEPTAVPYRLTDTHHVMVRTKFNGQGPFNFILDTGAPACFLTAAVGKKLGAKADDDGWTVYDRLELEGGVKLEKVRARAEDLFQLKGMNGMGAAGVELHGVLGFNVLARFQIQYDFTADKLLFTPLPGYKPEELTGPGRGGQPGGLEALGSVMQFAGKLFGMNAALDAPKARGFLGVELAETDDAVAVKAVLADSPAAAAGLQPGDTIKRWEAKSVSTVSGLARAAGKHPAGQKVKLTVLRGGKELELPVTLGTGF